MLLLQLDERYDRPSADLQRRGISLQEWTTRFSLRDVLEHGQHTVNLRSVNSTAKPPPELPAFEEPKPIELIESIADAIKQELEIVDPEIEAEAKNSESDSTQSPVESNEEEPKALKFHRKAKPLNVDKVLRTRGEPPPDVDGVSLWETEEARRERLEKKRKKAGKEPDDLIFWSPTPARRIVRPQAPTEEIPETVDEEQYPFLAAMHRETAHRRILADDDGEIEKPLPKPKDEVSEYTLIEPGPDKVDLLAARYAAGLPLHPPKDRKDHGTCTIQKKSSASHFGGHHRK